MKRAYSRVLLVLPLLAALFPGVSAAQSGVTDLTSGDSAVGLGARSTVTMGGRLYFPWCGSSGCELWRTDGTASGTVLVRDIEPGPGSSTPSGLTVIGSTLYFAAFDSTNGRELWRSDGTSAGTVLVRNIASGSASSSPSHLVALGTSLIFSAYESASVGVELWGSNGTTAGTTRILDIYSGATSSSPEELTSALGFIYFSAEHAVYGRELWRTNGTAAGTIIVSDIVPGAGWSDPHHLTAFGASLAFAAHSASTGNELYTSDISGTRVVRDIFAGTGSSDPSELTINGSLLYFSAKDASAGQELWRSDGSEAGTTRVKDIRAGAAGSFPRGLRMSGSLLFFAADDGATGNELWKSDGADAGTARVKDLWTGVGPSSPTGFAVTSWGVVFSARGTEGGAGLYRSNGTAEGTTFVLPTATSTFGEVDQTMPLGVGLVVSAFSASSPFNRLTFLSDQALLGPTLSVSDTSVAEGESGNSLLAFTVSLSIASTSDVTVNYATSAGTAAAGTDYTEASGSFVIPAGSTSKKVMVVVKGDNNVESSETVTFTLTNPAGAALTAASTAVGTITNDDPAIAATTVTQYRLYHDGTKEHLYTTDLNEYNVLGTRGWTQEGVAYRMLTNGIYNGVATIPLFRLYHPGIQQHHWTTDSNEATTLGSNPAWFYEGTIGYLLPSQVSGSVALYRMSLANPPIHLWTTDQNEYTVLATRGWTQEGIIGYVIP
jgi:ELWxxDGT repeat protein